MTTVADLGWAMARASITKDEAELTIVEPASADDPAVSITISGLDAIIALRDCIDEEIARLEQSLEISKELAADAARLTPFERDCEDLGRAL